MIFNKIKQVGLIGLFAISIRTVFGDSFSEMIEKFDGKNFPQLATLQQYNSTFTAYHLGYMIGIYYTQNDIEDNLIFWEKVLYLYRYKDIYFDNLNNVYLVFLETYDLVKKMAERYQRSLNLDWEHLREIIIREKNLTEDEVKDTETDFEYYQKYGCLPGEAY